ncbi:unnamed protein product [Ranitomeya imitator]|uniref:ribonuclease H n=1 Tax=Ranitomeya imitator TaxID=111125 RepID=A0ABN9LYF7_9NEOB|nr:unnamed protein product [Ranitomeya imitator]
MPLNITHNVSNITHNATYITHNASNITHNASNITHNASNITHNATNITHNATNITHNVSNITHNATNITHNASNITHNASNITHNASNITHNVSNITHNASNITHNASNITHNASNITLTMPLISLTMPLISLTMSLISLTMPLNITHNVSNITHNATYITHNVSNITHNATNITHNVSNITHNATYITHNASNITHNATYITHNASNITHNATNITHNASNIIHNVSNITHNASNITHNATYITHNASNITHNASNITHNATNITHNASNITHNASYITHNATYITHNASNITHNSTNITHNASNITHNASNITHNASYITHNATYITHNASNITHNASNITHNASNISLTMHSNITHNASNITHNASNITHNVSNITHNASNITHNASNITHNVSNITHNVSNITHNASNITHNASNITHIVSNITHNASNITHNASNITHIVSNITHNASNITHNATYVTHNSTYITHNASNITHNATYITHNVTNITHNATNITHNATISLTMPGFSMWLKATGFFGNSATNSLVDNFENAVSFLPPIVLNFELPPDYPSTAPPNFTLSCKWLSPRQLTLLCQHLDDLWEENSGCVVLFPWIQFLKEETLDFLNIKSPYEIELSSNGLQNHGVLLERGSFDKRAIQDVQSVSALVKCILVFNEAQEKKVFESKPFLCNICFMEKLGSECTHFKDCQHVYCNCCLKDYFEIQIKDGQVHALNCPEPKCKSVATPAQVKRLVGEQLFSRFDHLLLQSSLDLMADVVYCPRLSCQTPVMVEPEGTMGICSVCQYAFCILCNMTFHGISPCNIPEVWINSVKLEALGSRFTLHTFSQDLCSGMDVQGLFSRVDQLAARVQSIQDYVVQTPALEPKIPTPDLFFGDRSKFLNFKNNCKLFFALKPRSSGDPIQQVKIIISLLRGDPQDWAFSLESEDPALLNVDAFFQALGLLYDEPNSVDHAEKTLLALCQGQEAAELYCQKFRKWSVLTKWNEDALAAIFKKGLSEALKDVMVGFPTPAGLSESMSLAIQIDRRLRERKAVHHMALSSERSPEPMQCDRILTRTERQEFRGAALNLMDLEFARCCGFSLQPLQSPIPLRGIDATPLAKDKPQYWTQMTMYMAPAHQEDCRFLVLHNLHDVVVLGFPWLQEHNPVLDWKTMSVTSWGCQGVHSDVPLMSISSSPSSEVPEFLSDFQDVFDEPKSSSLPPHRDCDCAINLIPGCKFPKGRLFNLSVPEHAAMRSYVKESLEKGHIRPSSSPLGAGFFFVAKKDGSLRPCIDYRLLNKITVKFQYSLPLLSDLFAQIKGASWFTKLDLRGAYNLVRIKQGDEWKTAFNTPEGHFEYLVMPFGLSNAPSVFQSFMHDIFRNYLDKFMVIYLDDILIFSDDWESHVKQVRMVFQILRDNALFVKGSKKFSPAERNYDVGNRELLAMKLAFEEWRHWLEEAKHRVVVLTDHKNLIYLESAKRLNPRQARWSLFFSRFDFVVSYLPGSKNVKADALSRSFLPDSPGVLEPVGILKEGVILSAISPDLRRVLREFQADKPDRCPVGKLFVPDRWTSKTNGQTERTNQTLETYLRCFVSADQDDWVAFLPLAEFALNNRASSATLVLPFFCNFGFHPRFSSGQVEPSDCPGVDSVVDRLQQIWTHVVDNLTLSQEKAQRFANRCRLSVWINSVKLEALGSRFTLHTFSQSFGTFPARAVWFGTTAYSMSSFSTLRGSPVGFTPDIRASAHVSPSTTAYGGCLFALMGNRKHREV